MPDQSDEYNSLRQELILHQSRRDQLFYLIMTLIIGIFGFSVQFESPFLPILALLILLFGKLQLNMIDFVVDRIGSYIRIELEGNNSNLKWEKLIHKIHLERPSISTVAVMNWILFLSSIITVVLAVLIGIFSNQANAVKAWLIVGIGWFIFWRVLEHILRKIYLEEEKFWRDYEKDKNMKNFPSTSPPSPSSLDN